MTGPKVFRPQFVNEADYSWLGLFVEECSRFEGRTRHELAERMREPFPFAAPPKKLEWAKSVCSRLICDQPIPAPHPRELREHVFVAASARYQAGPGVEPMLSRSMRTSILESVAHRLDLSVSDIDKALFADLPERRIVAGFDGELAPSTLALKINLAMVQHYLALSRQIIVRLSGEARRVVRQAKFKGLICVVTSSEHDESAVTIEISGPFSLFRYTRLYGRALGTLVPFLAWCPGFVLDAHCEPQGKLFVMRIHSGDPIFPDALPPTFDSKTEAWFAKDFLKAAPGWDLVREPKPLRVGDSPALIFPDFAIVHRTDPTRFWYLEIVGFWTEEYLTRKCEALRQVVAKNFIVCLDETLGCGDGQLPASLTVIKFRKRVDAQDVIAVIEKPTLDNLLV